MIDRNLRAVAMIALLGRLEARLRQHVLGQEKGQSARIIAVRLFHRSPDHFELARVDHQDPTDTGLHLL